MVSLGDIQAARERIRGAIRQTPVLYSEILSREAGNQLFLKLENLNVTGSYKERGALNKILTLTEEERARGVITASAGNHAQAVAYHASQRGIRAQICMPEFTPAGEGDRDARLGRGSDPASEPTTTRLSRKPGAAAAPRVWCFSTPSTIPQSSPGRAPSGWSCWSRFLIWTPWSFRWAAGA